MSLKTRIEILEKKMCSDNDNGPSCVIICAESGRLDAVPDDSAIIRYMADNVVYDREQGETEKAFTMRAAKAAKAKLPSQIAVPVLMAVTENMIKG